MAAEGFMNLVGACAHIRDVAKLKRAVKRECEECVKIGAKWLHLRTCQSCGGTRCCDSSPNQHASHHAKSAGHPVICSAEPGENWVYCFPDDNFVEY
jgi:Zn-finger in ubiquitin-hydrolases and other protein